MILELDGVLMDKETEGSKGGSGLNTGGGVNGIVTNGGGGKKYKLSDQRMTKKLGS